MQPLQLNFTNYFAILQLLQGCSPQVFQEGCRAVNHDLKETIYELRAETDSRTGKYIDRLLFISERGNFEKGYLKRF